MKWPRQLFKMAFASVAVTFLFYEFLIFVHKKTEFPVLKSVPDQHMDVFALNSLGGRVEFRENSSTFGGKVGASQDLRPETEKMDDVKKGVNMAGENIDDGKSDVSMAGENIDDGKNDVSMAGENIDDDGKNDVSMAGENIDDDGKNAVSMAGENIDDGKNAVSMAGENIDDGKNAVSMAGENIDDGKNDVSTAGENIDDGKNDVSMAGENIDDGKNDVSMAEEKINGVTNDVRRTGEAIHEFRWKISPKGKPAKSRERKLKILLLSSLGRSGSSFLGELLAQTPNTFYYFEPLMYLQKQTKEGVRPESSLSALRKIFSCQLGQEDKIWVHDASKRGRIRQNGSKPICQRSNDEFARECVQNACSQNSNIVVKVIRVRVAWVKELLADPEYSDVKVIHLVRDPRGTIYSQKKRHMYQDDPVVYCPLILQDLRLRSYLKEKFPHSFSYLSYENFCIDPKGVARDLWRFISEDAKAELPPRWSEYLQKHTDPAKSAPRKPFGTWRDTQNQYQKWRTDIPLYLFAKVERNCGDVIDFLGHRRFLTIDELRNLSLPLL